jgi:hypothetical protein
MTDHNVQLSKSETTYWSEWAIPEGSGDAKVAGATANDQDDAESRQESRKVEEFYPEWS